jgi:serine/threonine protein kinase
VLKHEEEGVLMKDYRIHYRLDPKQIARGGQAEVFRATHKSSGQIVAIKRRTESSEVATARMRREIEVQARVQHVNVMPILDFDTDDHAWFVMPFALRSLDDVTLPLGVDDLAEVIRDAASGLQVAHELGFIHRDVKPSNVLWLEDSDGARWVVADWGLVRRPAGQTTVDRTRPGGVALGTDGFAPPESYVDSHAATSAWDIYSLGRLAAWAVTGTRPVPSNELVLLCYKNRVRQNGQQASCWSNACARAVRNVAIESGL